MHTKNDNLRQDYACFSGSKFQIKFYNTVNIFATSGGFMTAQPIFTH